MPYNLQEREQDFYEAFDEAIQTMVKERVDAVVHAGDIFDIPKPGGRPLMQFLNGLKLLKDKDIKFFFTLGEHDISRMPDVPSSFLFKELDLATYVGDGKPHSYKDLTVVGFHKHRKTEIEELRQSLRALESTEFPEGKKVLVLHQGLVEFHKFAGELLSTDLPKGFDCYMMGHLHDHYENTFDGFKGPVCYPGSTEVTSSEGIHEYEKGFYITDLSGGEANPHWIRLESTRPGFSPNFSFETLAFELAPFVQRLDGLAKKAMVAAKVRGENIDGAIVASALRSLVNHVLYYDWTPVEAGVTAGKEYEERPSDIDQEILNLASKITGSGDAGGFAVGELLPLLAEKRIDEATDLLWATFKARRFDTK
jgi:DNA repair protein SbcD/Mre11